MGLKIVYSSHAEKQLAERNLSRAEVERVIRKPQKLIRQSPGRFRAIGRAQRRGKQYLLVVIYERGNSQIDVVTAFLTSKLQKYL